MQRAEILEWLRQADETRLEDLWRRADEVRRVCVGDEVHLRALVEISNFCSRDCHYCGIRASRRDLARYRMSADEILACAAQAVRLGYGTIVLQSGDDPGIRRDWMCDVIRRIRRESPLAITLSLGERSAADLAAWREAGADRYLLRFETSNPRLFRHIHPSLANRRSDRIQLLRRLRRMGFEVGSGVMVGIPGQSCEDLASDIEWFRALDLDMIGIGPFLPHPDTPLGRGESVQSLPPAQQVPNDELTTCKVVALARLVCPYANIPSTTALATVNRDAGREHGLMRGANVVMPNLTPPQYRCQYDIYPDKACIHETERQCDACLRARIERIGRRVGRGPGESPNWRRRIDARRALESSDRAATV
ncbi:MAG: [FeFe] hydrogenase H-cluster radical SAM maturase HydE [Phycisphaerae bacterium]|jgi:biotin synthase